MITPTPQQLAAISQRDNFVLTAIPGSGKTFVVGKRIHDIHRTELIQPFQGIAALSFTNNASKEIEETYYSTSGSRVRNPDYVGTIDGFLNQYIVTPYAHLVMGNSTKQPQIITSNDFLFKRYPRMNSYKRFYAPLDVTYKVDGTLTHTLSGYEAQMKQMMYQNNLLGLGDISYFAMKILEKTDLIKGVINRFPYIMVDEAQDCSDVQMKIVDMLVEAGHNNIMLIGDPFQSIYVWRNARPELFNKKVGSWNSLSLDVSQRSGSDICRLLNQFHQDEEHIKPCVEVTSCNVLVISTEGLDEVNSAAQYFLEKCKEIGIGINKDNVGILCGSNGLVSKFYGVKENKMYDQWKNDHAACYSLPIRAKSKSLKADYAGAVDLLLSFFFYQKMDVLPNNKEQLEESGLLLISNKVLIWKCLHAIPDFDRNLDDWISQTNVVLKETADLLGIEFKYPVTKKRFRAGQEPTGILASWLVQKSESTYTITSDMTIETVHQAKGKSYNAVLVPFVSRSQKISISKLTDAIREKSMFRNEKCEDERCIYVAFSRPKRLLVISVPKNKDLSLFPDFTTLSLSKVPN